MVEVTVLEESGWVDGAGGGGFPGCSSCGSGGAAACCGVEERGTGDAGSGGDGGDEPEGSFGHCVGGEEVLRRCCAGREPKQRGKRWDGGFRHAQGAG